MKKLLALVLALVMSMSLVTISNAAFKDADSIDYKEAVEVMNAVGVLIGDENQNFNAKAELTRAQAAKIIAYLDLGGKAAEALDKNVTAFSDVAAGNWATGFITYCQGAGYVAGVGNGKFDPEAKVTGYAFAKMLLGVLGYDADKEVMTGADWQINVAKLVSNAGLAKNLAVTLSKNLTREEAAQMAINALKADMVDYEGGTKVEGNGMTVTVDSNRYYVSNGSGTDYANAAADTTQRARMQLCEKLYSNLKVMADFDDYGRPADKWSYGGTSIGTYANVAPDYTYTTTVKEKALYKTVGATIAGYHWFHTTNAGTRTPATAPASGVSTAFDGTGAGVKTEVYVNSDDQEVYVVYTQYVIAQVTKVTGKAVSYTYTASETRGSIDKDSDFFDKLTALGEDAYFAALIQTGTNKLLDVAEVTKVTGNATKYISADDAYTIGGTNYIPAKGYRENVTVGSTNYDLYVDANGFILFDKATTTAASNYLFVLDLAKDGNAKSGYSYMVKVLYTDGTTEWVELGQVGEDNTADCTAEATFNAFVTTGASANKNTFFKYAKLSNEKLKIVAIESPVTQANNGSNDVSITKEDRDVTINGTTYNTTSKTTYLVKSGDSYTVHTGYKAMPATTIDASEGGKIYVLAENNIAKMFVMVKSSSAAASDYFMILNGDYVESTSADKTAIKTYDALVNGEVKTIDVKGSLPVAANTFYFGNTYANDGYVSTLGTAKGINQKVSLSTLRGSFNGNADDKIVISGDAKLKVDNGILTATAPDGSNSTSGYLADNFKAEVYNNVSGDANKGTVNTLKLDDELDAYGVAGDFILILTNDDKDVTNLYMVNFN